MFIYLLCCFLACTIADQSDQSQYSTLVKELANAEEISPDDVFSLYSNSQQQLVLESALGRFLSTGLINEVKNNCTAINELRKLCDNDHIEALELLADCGIYYNYSVYIPLADSVKYLERLSQLRVNSEDHFKLGFLYSIGDLNQTSADQGRALLHYQHSADLGNVKAMMALGTRYWHGIDVLKDENLANFYHVAALSKIYPQHEEMVNPVMPFPLENFNIRIPDFHGGLYYEASETPSSMVRSLDDIHLYENYEYTPADSDLIQIYSLMMSDFLGDYIHPRNYTSAFELAQICVRRADYLLGESPTELNSVDVWYYTRCHALLGKLYLAGRSTPQSIEAAEKHLIKATLPDIKLPTTSKAYGVFVPLEPSQDLKYLNETKPVPPFKIPRASLSQFTVDFQYGTIDFPSRENLANATIVNVLNRNYAYLTKPSDEYIVRLGAAKACMPLIEPLASNGMKLALQHFLLGNYRAALVLYLVSAELGLETAQTSSAFMLYQKNADIHPILTPLALKNYQRAFLQGNIDAGLYLADALYETKIQGKDAYLSAYKEVAETNGAQGAYNLANLYEMGKDVPQDFHLAKRYYDLALRRKDHFLPIQLALIRLKLKMWYNTYFGSFNSKDEASRVTYPPRFTQIGNNVDMFTKMTFLESALTMSLIIGLATAVIYKLFMTTARSQNQAQ
ncbi:hypothetical protein LJB42_004047 [Komagataella kurtzmanii]|nr:hypothetical protein LJB42_004047 [Komagataella kurtzmanii]